MSTGRSDLSVCAVDAVDGDASFEYSGGDLVIDYTVRDIDGDASLLSIRASCLERMHQDLMQTQRLLVRQALGSSVEVDGAIRNSQGGPVYLIVNSRNVR